MTVGTDCPNCAKDIGVASIIKAPLPNMMKCPHCNVKIKYKNLPWLILLTCVTLYVLLIIVAIINLDVIQYQRNRLVELLIIFALWMPFEVVIARALRKNSELVLK